MLLNAFSGCDTTSQFCGIGKGTAFEILRKNENAYELIQEFLKIDNNKEIIEKTGENAALVLFEANQYELTINVVRTRMFSKKVAKATNFVKPERLPPTNSALKFHSFRVYFQIMKWLGIDTLKTEDWGWVNVEGKLLPRTTDKQPTPDSLLKTIGCSCNSDYSSMRCGCRKGSYSCSSVCGNCQMKGCPNVDIVLEPEPGYDDMN